MRLLVVAQTWEPEEGVPQRRWAWLTRALTSAGHEVHVLAPPPHYPTGHLLFTEPEYQFGAVTEGNNGEIIHRSDFLGHDSTLYARMRNEERIMASQIRLGRKLVREWRPDLVLATAPPLPAAISAHGIAAGNKIPIVIDLRDAWPDLLDYMNVWAPSKGRPARRGRFKQHAFRGAAFFGGKALNRVLRDSAAVITTTDSFGQVLRDRGVSSTLTVRNFGARRGVELDNPPLRTGLRILYVGTTGRAQELSNALHALAEVRKRGVDARMRIVGSGAHLKTLRNNAETLDIPVEFTGRLPYRLVMEHYEWADTVLIHLQDWAPMSHTVPSKLYEALEIGRHISLSVNGEAAEIIAASGAGDAVPAMDRMALADLWAGLARNRERLNTAGRGIAWLDAQGTPDDNAQRFVRFIEGIVDERVG